MGALLFLVIFSAIFVLFAEEIIGFIKQVSQKHWVRTFVPLLVFSWIWVWFDELTPSLLAWLQSQVIAFAAHPASVLPVSIRWVAFAFNLFLFASLPAWITHWLANKHGMKEKAHFVSVIYFFSWLCFAILTL